MGVKEEKIEEVLLLSFHIVKGSRKEEVKEGWEVSHESVYFAMGSSF